MKSKKYRAGAYARLSKDDGDKLESDSIRNQKDLIQDYISRRDDICFMDDYVDDGYSGSNFDRPAFKRLMEDVDSGAINCIVVKDLSRFGRNYIEVGRYLERIFPAVGVRLIAINDNYDGAEEWTQSDSILVPFKNLINDMYCRDMSYKIKSQLEIKRKHGECVSSFIPYGYQKDVLNPGKLIIDEEAAENVREIFRWYVDGIPTEVIAERLNKRGICSPLEYKRQHGSRLADPFKTKETALWAPNAVRRILENEVYLGNLVQGKRKKVNYRMKTVVHRPKEEWIKVENTHEEIVDEWQYDLARELLNKDKRKAPGMEKLGVLSGFVECASCHQNMVMRSVKSGKKTYFYLICSTYKMDRSCTTHNISSKKVEECVLHSIQQMAMLSIEAKKLLDQVDRKPMQKRKLVVLDKQMENLKLEIERTSRIRQKTYEDYAANILNREEFLDFSKIYMDKITDCEKKIECIKKERMNELNRKNPSAEWIKAFQNKQGITALSRGLMVELVERVIIHDNKQIEIRFRFRDSFQDTVDLLWENSEWQEYKKIIGKEGDALWPEKVEEIS